MKDDAVVEAFCLQRFSSWKLIIIVEYPRHCCHYLTDVDGDGGETWSGKLIVEIFQDFFNSQFWRFSSFWTLMIWIFGIFWVILTNLRRSWALALWEFWDSTRTPKLRLKIEWKLVFKFKNYFKFKKFKFNFKVQNYFQVQFWSWEFF